MLPRSAADFYAGQQNLTVEVIRQVRRLWRRMGNDFDGSWREIGARISAVVAAGQLASVRQVDPYMAAVLEETAQTNDPVGRLSSRQFVGVAADGRPLTGLLYGSVTTAKHQVAEGATASQALAVGGWWLDMATQTALADTSRSASAAAITARPTITGYTRMLNPPSCSRCVVLAGAHYRWNDGFQRHPLCDCRHVPSSENTAGDLRTDPNRYFESLDPGEQDRIFGKAGAEAIREGADIGQVVNARKGMYTTGDGLLATRTGTTRRGLAGRRMRDSRHEVRLMPDEILKISESREQAVALLKEFGFIV